MSSGVLPFLLVLLALCGAQFDLTSIVAPVAPGLFWLILCFWTGDRRLYFPYTMQYAAH